LGVQQTAIPPTLQPVTDETRTFEDNMGDEEDNTVIEPLAPAARPTIYNHIYPDNRSNIYCTCRNPVHNSAAHYDGEYAAEFDQLPTVNG